MWESTQNTNDGSQRGSRTARSTLCDEKISAIILAAGHSKRMGVFKPLLKLRDRTILECDIRFFRDLGIEDVIVVVGHRANEIIPIIRDCSARVVFNEQFETGMFSSVQAGVKALGPDSQAFFLLPVDIPLVQPQTIRHLLEAYHASRGKIVFPVFRGRRGHPPLVDGCYRSDILSYPGEEGLRGVFRKHEAQSVHVHVADEMILFDLDTPADYEALAARFR